MLATNPVIFGWAEQLLGRDEVATPVGISYPYRSIAAKKKSK